MMWQNTVFDSTIGVLFRNKKFHMDSMSRSVDVDAGLITFGIQHVLFPI